MIGWRDIWSRDFARMTVAFIVGRAIYEILRWLVLLVWR